MKQVHHYSTPLYNRPAKIELAAFGVAITLVALLLGLLCLSGCADAIQAAPTQGGRLVVERPISAPQSSSIEAVTPKASMSKPMETLQFTQGDNANTPSTLETGPNGQMKIVFGTVEKPILALPSAPDYTMYWCLAAGIVFIGGGIALACYGWPQIGARLFLAGVGMVVFALTVKSYGWVYVVGIAGLAAWIAWEKFHGYTIGVAQATAQPKQA